MTKSQFIDSVAEKSGLDKASATKAVGAVLNTLTEAFAKEEKVQFVGFGTFTVRKTAARTGRSPATGEPVEIAAKTTPVFKASKSIIK